MSAPVFESIDDELLLDHFVEDPYPSYARLRREDRVHWSEPWGAWVVSRYADVMTVLREDGLHYSVRGRIAAGLKAFTSEQQTTLHELADHYGVGLLHSDPPDHTRQRALVNRVFSPRAVERMHPNIRQIVDELIDQAAPHGEMDMIAEFAFPLPATVVADVLGVPRADQLQVKVWVEELNAFLGSNGPTYETAIRSQDSLRVMRAYLTEVAAERLANPRDDVLSRLAAAVDQPDGISLDELLSTSVTMLVGGHVTTTALISSAVFHLSRHPEQLARIRSSEDTVGGAVEEVLRFESPNQRILRVAREQTELGGKTIRPGDLLMLLIGSANRDEEQFEDAHLFDSARTPNRHLAFAIGEHFCIGASLARAEGAIAVGRLLERFPGLEVFDDSPKWSLSPTLRVMREMRVGLR